MTDAFDKIADGIADFLVPGPKLPSAEGEKLVLKPLPVTVESTEAVVEGRGFGDLVRFNLPAFKGAVSLAQVPGFSALSLRELPRKADDALKVTFPDPVYGIWLDPNWTSPGAQIGIGYSGSNRQNFFILTPGKGVRFKNPVRDIRILNMDGLEQLMPVSSNNNFSFGYVSFLAALSPEANYEGEIPGGPANVSSLIQNGSAGLIQPDGVGFAFIRGCPVACQALRAVTLEFLALHSIVSSAAVEGWAASLQLWFMSAFTTDPLTTIPPTNVDVWGPSFGFRWIRGDNISVSCMRKSPTESRNAGARARVEIPPGAFAMTLSQNSFLAETGSDADFLIVNVYGENR